MDSLQLCKTSLEEKETGDVSKEMDQMEYSNPKKRYEKLGCAGIEGSLYQINLLTLVLLNGMRKVKNWRLSTEDKAAPQLDDLIFEHLPSESAILLQAKHKKDEKIVITYQDLMSVNKKSEFSLPKYFFSYLEVKNSFKVQNVVICTNLKLDEYTKNILKEESVDPDSVLYFEGAENVCYGFSGCSFPKLEQNIKMYQVKHLKNKVVTISHEDIDVFLNHLKFFPNCLGDKNVENIMLQTISLVKFSENLTIKMIREDIRTKMTDWFKEEKGRYLTEVEAKAFFCDMRSNKYCEDLKLYDVRFKRNNLPLILQTQQKNEEEGKKSRQPNENDAPAEDPKRISHVIIYDKEYMLNVVKIYQALPAHHKDKTLFVNPEEAFEVQRQIIDAFEVQHYTILVMVCPNNRIEETAVKQMCDKVMKVLNAYKYKHVILIAEEENDLATQLKHASNNYYEVIADNITFADLEETTQAEFKRKGLINFQGSTISLEELFTPSAEDDLNEVVSSEMLIKLARGEKSKVGQELLHPDNYYISRRVNKTSQSLSEEELWSSTEEKVILISDSAGMGKSCVLTSLAISIKRDNPHLWVVRLDLNNYTNIMKTTLAEGRKSVSIIELLNSQETSKIKSEFGRKLFTTSKRVVVMLDAVDEISPTYTHLVINLIRNSLVQVNVAKLFVTTRPHICKEISELQSFTSSKNHEEETPDLKFFTLEPFSKDNQKDFLIRFWTETLNLQNDVQKGKCKIFAESLIKKMSVWINNEDRNTFAGIPLQTRMLAEIFQEKSEFSDEEQEWEGCKQFLSFNNEEPKLPTRIDLTQLYEMFINKKRDIFIKNHNPSGLTSIDELLEAQFEKCQDYHRALALKVIFDSDNALQLFTYYKNVELKIPATFENSFLFRVGIVQKQGENIEFLHRTFAEFFVADCLLIELDRKPVNKEFQQFFTNLIMLENRYSVIRAFLDSRTRNVWHLIENHFCKYFHRNRISEEALESYFNVFAEEGCARIFECFIKCIDKEQRRILSKAVNELHLMYDALDSATRYGHLNILKLLLELNETFNKEKDAHKQFLAFVVIYAVNNFETFQFLACKVDESDKNILSRSANQLREVAYMGRFGKVELWVVKAGAGIKNKDNIRGSMAHRGAVSMSLLEVVKFVVEEIGGDINAKDKKGETALHRAVYWSELEIIKYLVKEAKADTNVTNIEGETAFYIAAYRGKLDIAKFLVQEAEVDKNVKNWHGDTALHKAAYEGRLEIVKYLVEETRADINVKNSKGETALHEAAFVGPLELVRYLVEVGADINVKNSKGETALYRAAYGSKLDIIKYLVGECRADINVKNNQGRTALDLAVLVGKLEIVQYLVEQLGADRNAKNSEGARALHIAAYMGNLELVKYLVEEAGVDKNTKNNEGETAIHGAAHMCALEIVKYLVEEAGADVNVKNSEGETALHKAVYWGKLELVKFLVEGAKADVNIKNRYGTTALHNAVYWGRLEIVRYLVEEAGADISVKRNEGDTALYIAACRNELEIVKYLVEEAGADKNVKNSEGKTALHAAAYYGKLEIVKYLLEEAGVDKNIKNNQGRTAVQVAADQGHWMVVQFLSNSSRFVMFKMKTIQFFRGNFS